jgi:dTDP-4-dehydrorhamnose 3,5-epimerase
VNVQINTTQIPGCYQLTPTVFQDQRGRFVKTFHEQVFAEHHLQTNFAEEYYSVSHQGVLRGLHFQLPPQDHTKLVYCVQGQVTDVVVDLRVGSPTYLQAEVFDLSAEKANLIYVPPGLAHGFYVTSAIAIMIYKVTTTYAADYDTGIHWNSAGIAWTNPNPIVSQRDSEFPPLSAFQSPFVYNAVTHVG